MIDMRLKLQIFLVLLCISTWGYAQVGIGNPNPDSTSILDLSNPNNKGFILPEALSQSTMSPSVGMMYSFQDNIFFNTSNGYNSISPWKFKFNGDISNHIYFNLNGNICIGSTDINTPPEAPLQIETDIPLSLLGNGSLILGKADSLNMVFNSNEIQSRNNGTAVPLSINRNGGDVVLGADATPVNLQVSNKNKQLNKLTNSYYDLMPTGAIVMWSGTPADIPLGWALCDGSKYPTSINKNDSIVSPDLSGRFIVMAGDNGMHNYEQADTGGQDHVTITIQTMASHQHYSHDSGHGHGYTYKKPETSGHGDDAHDESHADGNTTNYGTTSSAWANIAEDYVGGNMPHENRPNFYALVFIIKL